LSGQLVITQTRSIHEKIQKLLSDLRAMRALQVSVEVRFLTLRGGFIENIGMTIGLLDFDFDIDDIFFVDKINEFSLFTTLPFDLGVGRDFTTTGGLSGELLYQFTDDIFLDLLISAVQKAQEADVMDAPMLTMYNGQAAFLEVNTEQVYISGMDVVAAASAIGIEYETDTLTTGVTFNIRPFVSADRRYVQMTLTPSITQLIGLTTLGVPLVVNNQLFEATIQLPTFEETTIGTTVSVPDNGTLMIGGLTATFDGEGESGVPFISKVPFLQRFFTRTVTTRERRNLIIIVRPQIIIQEEHEPT
jgi:general secretion pathway protein D